MNIHTETYNAFKQAGVPEEPAQRAAIAVAGEQSAIMAKLTQMERSFEKIDARFEKMERDIDNKFEKMEGDMDKRFSKLEKDIREDIHSLDKKFLIITTIMSSTLPIIGGMLFFVLKAIN